MNSRDPYVPLPAISAIGLPTYKSLGFFAGSLIAPALMLALLAGDGGFARMSLVPFSACVE